MHCVCAECSVVVVQVVLVELDYRVEVIFTNMQCMTPIWVRANTQLVPCGKCAICKSNNRKQWITRLKAEYRSCDLGLFVTLTYDDEHLPRKTYVCTYTGECVEKPYSRKRDIQLFLKRIRKIYPGQIRYFVISEYGDRTLRPHWHMLFFFSGKFDKKLYDDILDCWKNGHVQFGDITEASITYVTKYAFKPSEFPFGVKDTCMLCSKNPAIGSVEIEKHRDYAIRQRNFTRFYLYGCPSSVPRLYRDKWLKACYGDEEKTEYNNSLSLAISEANRKLQKEFKNSCFDNFQAFLHWKLSALTELKNKRLVKHDKI